MLAACTQSRTHTCGLYCVSLFLFYPNQSTELTALDCLFMGKHAFNDGAYAQAVEWFEDS
jgi:hypothetical protein